MVTSLKTSNRGQDSVLAPKSVFRADIQALRALAVLVVVLNHLWPHRLTGGFVGVDVFFVISGFLITTHLVKEISASSTVSLRRFYARRIKRLLPAAFTVLAIGMLAVFIFVPYSEWMRTAKEVVASAIYVENWALTAAAVDYSAATADATIAQHYWSLSVEEQFYIVWPILLLVVFRLGKRWWNPQKLILVVLIIIALLSFLLSVTLTQNNPSAAYFVTPVRVWEFAVGGLIAIGVKSVAAPRSVSRFIAIAGWLAILTSAMTFNPQTAFPGYMAALPVLGTAAVIFAGSHQQKMPLNKLVAFPPIRWLGDVSYSLYLWHWPLIVIAPYVLKATLSTPTKLAIFALSLLLAWISKTLIEDGGKDWRIVGKKPAQTFIAMITAMVAISLLAGSLMWMANIKEQQAEITDAAHAQGPCYGPSAMQKLNKCPDGLGPAEVTVMGAANRYYSSPPPCITDQSRKGPGLPAVGLCDYSQGDPKAKRVWLVGDSHAEQWKPAMVVLAKKNNWHLSYGLLGGCPVADVNFVAYQDKVNPQGAKDCMKGSAAISAQILKEKPDMVFYSNFSRKEKIDDGTGRTQLDQYAQALPRFWNAWTAVGTSVYVLADPPFNGLVRDPKCVALNPQDPLRCAVPRAVAQPSDPLVSAVQTAKNPKIGLLDMSNYFCDSKLCYAVVGNVAVYFDANHLNADFSRAFAPIIQRALKPADK